MHHYGAKSCLDKLGSKYPNAKSDRLLGGAKAGAAIGAFAGPVGIGIGSLAGAVFAGLAGGTAGSVAGSKLGQELDEKVLDNYQCQSCGLGFRPLSD